ncbi:MAG: hypothetical protein ACYTBV_00005, partial [Planctomycetota bacterium]
MSAFRKSNSISVILLLFVSYLLPSYCVAEGQQCLGPNTLTVEFSGLEQAACLPAESGGQYINCTGDFNGVFFVHNIDEYVWEWESFSSATPCSDSSCSNPNAEPNVSSSLIQVIYNSEDSTVTIELWPCWEKAAVPLFSAMKVVDPNFDCNDWSGLGTFENEVAGMGGSATISPGVDEMPLNMPGVIDANGTHFELIDSEYLNITLSSSEPIHLVLESV